MCRIEPPPRLSFVTPAYRTEAYLPDTIRSVLAQTSDEWELVVVDNGNSDEVASIVGSYADPRIRLIRQENRGYTGGVMAGAAVARGDYLSVLDSDDQLTPDFVARILGFLESRPEADAVGCDAHLFLDGEENPFGNGYLHSIGSRTPAAEGDLLSVRDVLGGRVPYYTAAIRRSAWAAVGGYEPGVDGVDESVLIWLRLASEFRVYLLPDRLARYRVRERSLSREPDKVEAFEHSLIRTFELFAESPAGRPYADAISRPVARLRYHQALRRARWAFGAGEVEAARRFAGEAFALRRTPRAVVVVLLLRVAPELLQRAYPVKQRLQDAARHARQRLRPAR